MQIVAAASIATLLMASLTPDVGRAEDCALSIDEMGIGGIAATTAFDREAVLRSVPGCRVDQDAGASEGEPVEVLVIKQGDSPRALVFPDWAGGIFSIVVESSAVPNRLGHALGTPYGRIYGAADTPICAPGAEEASGRLLCAAKPGGRLAYLFEGSWDGVDGTLPPYPVLQNWPLVAFVWRPIPLEDPRWVDVGGFDPGEGPALVSQVKEAVDDPQDLARLVLYPITLRTEASGRAEEIAVPDAVTFATEYGRRLTPAFAAAVRDEPIDRVVIRDDGAGLGGGRFWIAPVCKDENCVEHRTGIVAVTMF